MVDDENKVIGAEFLFNAIEKGMIRRVSRIFVFKQSGELLIQQRSANVLKPLLLDQSAGGHVDEGETHQQAAERELFEELGINNVPVIEIDNAFRTKTFFNASYRVVIPDSVKIVFDSEEIEQVFWIQPAAVIEQMIESPKKFNPAFVETWMAFKEKLVP